MDKQVYSDGAITLGPYHPEDAVLQCEIDADPEHRRRFDCPDDFVPSVEHSRKVIASWEAERRAGTRFTFAVRSATSGELLGGCELLPKDAGTANVSYWTHPRHRGEGVATRAVAILAADVAPDLGFRRLEIVTDPDNVPSRRVAELNGFEEVETQNGQIVHTLQLKKLPFCIIVTGRPGSGKTTLAAKLAARLCVPLLSRDVLKEGYVNTHGVKHSELPADTNRKISALFFDLAVQHLSGGVTIVIEAAFQHKIWAANIDALKQVSKPAIILCSVPGELAAERHLQRGLDDARREHYHGDARVSRYRETGVIAPPGNYDPPNLDVPMMQVSTENGYDPPLEEVTRFTGLALPVMDQEHD